jgi:hypothetical protein
MLLALVIGTLLAWAAAALVSKQLDLAPQFPPEPVLRLPLPLFGQVLLAGIDVTFPAGAVSAVVGPSGSGKSSLLRILAAMDLATAGRVTVGGVELVGLSSPRLRQARRRLLGYVFQRPADNLIPPRPQRFCVRVHACPSSRAASCPVAVSGSRDPANPRDPSLLNGTEGEQGSGPGKSLVSAAPRTSGRRHPEEKVPRTDCVTPLPSPASLNDTVSVPFEFRLALALMRVVRTRKSAPGSRRGCYPYLWARVRRVRWRLRRG